MNPLSYELHIFRKQDEKPVTISAFEKIDMLNNTYDFAVRNVEISRAVKYEIDRRTGCRDIIGQYVEIKTVKQAIKELIML